MKSDPRPFSPPLFLAIEPWDEGSPRGVRHQILSEEESARIATIATVVRFHKGDKIYLKGENAEAAFNIIKGVVSIHASTADGPDHVTAFLQRGDVCGLSEEGRYANSAKAASSVIAYRIPIRAFRRLLTKDPSLDLALVTKLCEGLRETQRHAFILSRKSAASKVAMFIALQERLQKERGESSAEVHLPMDRSAIADFCGLTTSALSRSFRELTDQRIASFRDRQHLKIIDRVGFENLAVQ